MTYVQHTYNVPNPSIVRTIAIKDVDVPVDILPSGGDSMHAVYFESDRETYDIQLEGDTLSIRKRIRPMISLLMLQKIPEHVKLTLYLPEGYDGELSAVTTDGSIRVDGVTVSEMVLKTVDGDIEIIRTHAGGSITCTTHDGNVTAGRLTAAETSLKTTDGNIALDCPRISDKLSCRTTDGHIRGVLAGRMSDYTFAVRTVDGRSNLHPGGDGLTMCELRTTDGRIDVAFEDVG